MKQYLWISWGIAVILSLPSWFSAYLPIDESCYYLFANRWLEGYLPYLQIWDNKPILTPALYAVLVKTFGTSYLPIRIFLVLYTWISAYLLYKITKMTYAGYLYLILVFIPWYHQELNAEVLMNLPLLLGVYWIQKNTPSYKTAFYAGICMATATLFKYTAGATVLCLLLYIVVEKKWKRSFLILFGLGILVVYICLQGYLNYFHLSKVYWQITLWDNVQYVKAQQNVFETTHIGLNITDIGKFLGIFFVFSLLGYIGKVRQQKVWIFWGVGAAIAILAGGKRLYYHYFVQLIPFLAIGTTLFIHKVAQSYQKWIWVGGVIFPLVLEGLFFVSLQPQLPSWVSSQGWIAQTHAQLYPQQNQLKSLELVLNKYSPPGASLWIVGYEPHWYRIFNRKAVTPYLGFHAVVQGKHPLQFTEKEIRIESPQCILDTHQLLKPGDFPSYNLVYKEGSISLYTLSAP